MHLMGCRYVVSSLCGTGHLFPVLVQEMPVPLPPGLGLLWAGKVALPETVQTVVSRGSFEVTRDPGNQLLFI